MEKCLDSPSHSLLKYATLGINAARTGLQIKDLAALSKPYRFIHRLTTRRKILPHSPALSNNVKPSWVTREIKREPGTLQAGVADDIRVVQNEDANKPVVQNEGDADIPVAQNEGDLRDVFEVILNDPAYEMQEAPAPCVFITEQPAPKSLRFRYECEGRSAGSIPGVNSTPENRTFPTIKIAGYRGCMVIVVSCVTKEEPFRPHPHNLVGRDCSRGVCTVRTKTEGDSDSCYVQFRNLGIQCVKRRDIAEALRARRDLQVNPFKISYSRSQQTQSIDLNAVRLCFQVFLTDDSYKQPRAMEPIVSEVIYDKKAMSDLLIVRSSHCSGPAKGGTTVILLCEKVTREDIEVVFFHEEAAWCERGHIEFVHKQLAIVLKTPPYLHPDITEHVTVQFQLQRSSDGAKSNAYSFEYIPQAQGTKPLPDLAALAAILAQDPNNNLHKHTQKVDDTLVSSTSDSSKVSEDAASLTIDVNGNDQDVDMPDSNEKSLDDLLDQVAELDEIYTENRTRLENITSMSNDADGDDFNDAGTYTSLQLAFKNPVEINEPESMQYEDVQVHSYRGPIIEFAPLKVDDEKAPPLPPKRVRKISSAEPFKSSQTSVDSILKPGRQIPVTRNPEVLKRDRTELSVARSEPALPPVKKRSFFARLFRRREKSPAPSVKSEGPKEKKSKPVGRSVSSVSGLRPSKFKSSVSHTSLKDNASGLSYADSITHISLHGDGDDAKSASQTCLRRPASLAPLPPTDGGTILVAESVLALDAEAFKKLQDDLDLTEAEHYALYMAVAPHATASEFDETSYIQFIIASKKRKKPTHSMAEYENLAIKNEPRDPPHAMCNPGYSEAQWQPEVAGAQAAQYGGGCWPSPAYSGSPSPHLHLDPPPYMLSPQSMQMQVPMRSPLASVSPQPHLNPGLLQPLQPLQPTGQPLQPLQPLQPHQPLQPLQQMQMNMLLQPRMEPGLQDLAPAMPVYNQIEPSTSSTPSLTTLLMTGADVNFNSGDLANLTSMLNQPGDLSDSLNRLSTRDLLHPDDQQ